MTDDPDDQQLWTALIAAEQEVSARPDSDDDEFRRLAELLQHLQAWDALDDLVRRAEASDDPHTREVAGDFRRSDEVRRR